MISMIRRPMLFVVAVLSLPGILWTVDVPWSCNDDACVAVTAFEAIRDDDVNTAIRAFQELVDRDPLDSYGWSWLGRMYVWNGNLEAAVQCYTKAVGSIDQSLQADGDELEHLTLESRRAQLELDLRRVKERIEGDTSSVDDIEASKSLQRLQISRVHWRSLTQKRFNEEFAIARRPLIIEGLPTPRSMENWTSEFLEEACGGIEAPIKYHHTHSTEWAGMTSERSTNVSAFIKSLHNRKDMIFDWSLKQGCSALLESFRVPRLFSQSFTSYGPSLFIQPPFSQSGLHIDSGSTHFWQYLFQGQKRYRIFQPRSWGRLFEESAWRRAFFRDARCTGMFGEAASEAASCNDGFGGSPIDTFDEAQLQQMVDMTRGQGLEVMWEGVLQPGEVVFVPANAPHQIRNEHGVSIATTMNFVDLSNVEEAAVSFMEAPAFHPNFLARLIINGTVVKGSQGQWYQRQRIVVMNDDLQALNAALVAEAKPIPHEDGSGMVSLRDVIMSRGKDWPYA